MERYLLIADTDWTPKGLDPKEERWYYAAPGQVSDLIQSLLPKTKKEKRDPNRFRLFNGAIFAAWPSDADLQTLMNFLDAYRMIGTPAAMVGATSAEARFYLRCRQPFTAGKMTRPQLINWVQTRLFSEQIGTKLRIANLEFAPWYRGTIEYQGTDKVTVGGDFGADFRSIAYYRWGMFGYGQHAVNIWPEFEHDEAIEIRYVLTEMDPGDSRRVVSRQVVTESELSEELVMTITPGTGTINVAVEVRGRGQLTLGPVHYRWSRFEAGEFIPGGERLVDPVDRGELSFYFNPGDLKPPLNVYFSGYRTAEGFEGYYMMRSMKAPFILLADPRSEGGRFYLGSPALEQAVKDKITEKMNWLGFTRDQVNFSGLSMGSFGASYYGVQFRPHAIITVNSLLNIGTMAYREQTERFGVFPTSLDLLYQCSPNHELSRKTAKQLDDRLWRLFRKADLTKTKFLVTYMNEDDYDNQAYSDLIKANARDDKGCQIIGHGYPGYHRDGTGRAIQSFKNFYRAVLADDFGRGNER